MKVKIHFLGFLGDDPQTYIANNENECKDETDKMVYRLVVKHNDLITMGQVIGEPIRNH